MLQFILGFIVEANIGFLFLAIFHLAKQEDIYFEKIKEMGGNNE